MQLGCFASIMFIVYLYFKLMKAICSLISSICYLCDEFSTKLLSNWLINFYFFKKFLSIFERNLCNRWRKKHNTVGSDIQWSLLSGFLCFFLSFTIYWIFISKIFQIEPSFSLAPHIKHRTLLDSGVGTWENIVTVGLFVIRSYTFKLYWHENVNCW